MSRPVLCGLLALAAILTGCGRAESSSPAGINYQVDKLFTHEGCTVYRFQDYSYRYFVRCDNGHAETATSQSCGKACTSHTQIPTSDCRRGVCQ